MIIKEPKEITARTEEHRVAIQCDSCGKRSQKPHDWSEDRFDEDEIKISRRTGTSFPEGGSGTEFKLDLCPECFEGKLLKWLASENINGRTEEWDW